MARHVILIIGILIFVVHGQVQISPSCDLNQTLAIGRTYYIYNPTYPAPYGPNTRCRWISQAPVGYKVELNCNDINIASSPNCASDRLVVSVSGNRDFVDGHNYCGTGTLSLSSTTRSMSIGLFSVPNSAGGRVSCQIRAIVDTSPTTTTQRPTGCDCGWRQQRRIVGGTETGINEFPFAAGLINIDEKRLFCGATIIHYHYALTAAHCVNKINNIRLISLLVGDHDYENTAETNTAALYTLLSFVYHEQYNVFSQQHDIAIVRTQVDMTFSMAVGPACLPLRWTSSRPPVSSTVTVLGWGTTEFTGPASKVLLAANLSVVSNSYCQSEYVGRNQIFPTQICTYQDGKDACQSDSGGPVMFLGNASRRLYIIGVISYGIGCGMDYPGVNTRVTSYMEWITKNTLDASYCIK